MDRPKVPRSGEKSQNSGEGGRRGISACDGATGNDDEPFGKMLPKPNLHVQSEACRSGCKH